MSTYLLLRNNKQTGPFTIEEIKRMSLKSYDLVWIEGKSAAWRYPGEIPEFSSFAPAVPEQPYDRFFKKPGSETAKREAAISPPRIVLPNQSVYVNHPALEKRLSSIVSVPQKPEGFRMDWDEPIRLPDENKITVRPKRSTGKSLLIFSVVLMFVAGMVTGFFISNRRIFYSANAISTQTPVPFRKSQTLLRANTLEPESVTGSGAHGGFKRRDAGNYQEMNIPSGLKNKKKTGSIPFAKKDSQRLDAAQVPVLKVSDSVANGQATENKNNTLAAKIKANPSDYLIITEGKYKVGVLGGISEVPLMVTNRSGVTMDLVVVAVDYIQRNNKVFKTENISFHNLASGTTVTAEAPKCPRGVKITCRLTIADAQQIDLSYSNL